MSRPAVHSTKKSGDFGAETSMGTQPHTDAGVFHISTHSAAALVSQQNCGYSWQGWIPMSVVCAEELCRCGAQSRAACR